MDGGSRGLSLVGDVNRSSAGNGSVSLIKGMEAALRDGDEDREEID